jgi:hypothetical protein
MRVAPDCKPPLTARHAPSPHTSTSQSPPPSNKKQSTSCAPARGPTQAQDPRAVSHGRRQAAPGARPRSRPPSRPAPHDTLPRQQQQDAEREESRRMSCHQQPAPPPIARCSKDFTTHQHRPGDHPGRPCPVPACSGQPLPGERRLSSPSGNRIFSLVNAGEREIV